MTLHFTLILKVNTHMHCIVKYIDSKNALRFNLRAPIFIIFLGACPRLLSMLCMLIITPAQ